MTTVGASTFGLVGAYFEHETRMDGQSLPPLALITGGAVALISAVSILFLDDKPHSLHCRRAVVISRSGR